MKKGFTLVELLVVMAIIGILSTVAVGAFRVSQIRGRDAQRKSDLKQIANALELYLQDHGTYPPSSSGQILGCTAPSGACSWGSGEFRDTAGTVYQKIVPKDPSYVSSDPSSPRYYYVADSVGGYKKYKIFARLENPEDKNCLISGCDSNADAQTCGANLCNFAVTSTNTTAASSGF